MSIALGNVEKMRARFFALKSTKGARTKVAIVKRSSVSEIGCTIPASFLEIIKEPATKKVARITIR